MQQHGTKYFARRHPALGMGQIGQNLPFSEHGHIEYQFKGN